MTRVRSVAELVARRVAAVLAIVTLVAALGITSIALIQRELADYREQVTPLVEVTNNVRLTFTSSQVAFRGYLATGRPEYLPPYHDARQNLATAQAQFDRLAAPAIPADALSRVRETTTAWAQLADQGIRRRSQGQHIDLAPTTAIANTFHAELDEIERQVERFRTDRRAGYTGLITLGLQLTVGATLLALAIGVWLAVQIIRQVARPIRRLGDVVDAHAAGHEDARADPDLGTREVRAVAGTFNALANDRQATIRRQARDLELREATEDVAGILAAVPSTDGGWSPACERLGSVLDVDGVFVYSWSSDHDFVPLGGWTSPTKAQARLVVPQAVDEARRALTAPLTANDADGIVAVFPEALARAARREGITAWTLRPLTVGDHTVGVVSVWSTHARRWAHEELDAVDRFAFYAARAVTEHRYVETLRHLDAQKSNFLATTSHELRTPLTSMAGYLELLRDGDLGPLTPQQAKAWDVIDRHVSRLGLLIEDLLIINDLDSGRAGTAIATHGVDELLDRLRVRYAPEADERGVALSVPAARPDLRVRGDGEQLERAVAHVLANAVKFTPRGAGSRSLPSRTTTAAVKRSGSPARTPASGSRPGTSTPCSRGSSGHPTPRPSRSRAPGWG